MTDFKREERYIVVKIKDLDANQLGSLKARIRSMNIPTVECVVVESDWPNYDATWAEIKRISEEKESPEEKEAEPSKYYNHPKHGKCVIVSHIGHGMVSINKSFMRGLDSCEMDHLEPWDEYIARKESES